MANTPNLGLHQWAADDSFLRTDFNTDFSKIDAAATRIASGTYNGDGGTNHKITLGFKPKLLILMGPCYSGTSTVAFFTPAGAAWMNSSTTQMSDYSSYLTLATDGFTLFINHIMNLQNSVYIYFALC